MQVQRPHQPQQETANAAKWKKKEKEKNKNKKAEKSSLDVSKPNYLIYLDSIKSSSNYFSKLPKSTSNSHKIKFLLDTGASCNIVNKREYLHKYLDTTDETVTTANGEKVRIKGYGDVLWRTTDINGKVIAIKIKNVKLIPKMTENLLSLSSIFTQYKNATEIERKNDDLILKIRNNQVRFKMSNKLFKNVDSKEFPINVSAVKTTNISEDNFRMEHLRMAHLNSQDLAILLRSQGYKINDKTIKDFTCNECSKSKSTVKRPFNIGPIADKSITQPGQLIQKIQTSLAQKNPTTIEISQ